MFNFTHEHVAFLFEVLTGPCLMEKKIDIHSNYSDTLAEQTS